MRKLKAFLIGFSFFIISCGGVGGGADVGTTVIIESRH